MSKIAGTLEVKVSFKAKELMDEMKLIFETGYKKGCKDGFQEARGGGPLDGMTEAWKEFRDSIFCDE